MRDTSGRFVSVASEFWRYFFIGFAAVVAVVLLSLTGEP